MLVKQSRLDTEGAQSVHEEAETKSCPAQPNVAQKHSKVITSAPFQNESLLSWQYIQGLKWRRYFHDRYYLAVCGAAAHAPARICGHDTNMRKVSVHKSEWNMSEGPLLRLRGCSLMSPQHFLIQVVVFSCRFFALRLHQEAPQQGLLLQPLLLPVSGPARPPAGQQQCPPAGRGERNRLQGPGEATTASSKVKRLWKDLCGH